MAVMTEVDMQHAKLVGVMMLVGKLYDAALKDAADRTDSSDDAGAKAAKGYESLMKCVHQYFPSPGELEREVLALGKRMGFEIEQQIVPEGARRKQ